MARQVRQKLSPEQRRRRLIMTIVGIAVGLVVLMVLVGVVLYIQATGQPPIPRDAARGIEEGETASLNTMAQIAQVEAAVRKGQRQPVHLQLTNADLTQLISLHGPTGEVQDMQVYLGSGRVIARGRVSYQGKSLNLQAAIALSASGGQLQASISEMWIGSLQAPDALRQQMQEQLSKQIAAQTPQRLGVYVENISIEPGRATVTGYTMGK
ncbi:MAG: hypothetical protein GX358_01250 [candidate division WS1 bacterium]|jgi:hypothetical protein|nr:hypothetical protein [candidate division WS1 bacterium]